LFIDSGKVHPGFAWYVGTTFAGCGESGPAHDWADEVYFEMPVYNRRRASAPQSLIKCAAAGALAAGRHAGPCAHVEAIDVEWKGNVPKSIMAERLREWMTTAEVNRLDECLAPVPKGKRHDLLDAACMGKWWLREKGLRA
jgi:hypothetical protein